MGGLKDPGFLRVPNVPEYVRSACDITWMSTHEREGHGSTQTGVVVSVADRRGEPPLRARVVLETTPAPRDFAYEVRECARSVLCQPPKHGRWHDVLMVSEGPACKRSVTDKSLEHGRRNRTDLAANCFPRGPGMQYARYPRHEQWAWRARLGSPWENPNSQWQELKHKLACNRHMTEHLHGCRGLIIIGVSDSDGETLHPPVSAKPKERVRCRPPPWRCKGCRALPRVHEARPGCSEHPRLGQTSIS